MENARLAEVDLPDSNIQSVAEQRAWYERITKAYALLIPELLAAKANHQATLKRKEQKAKDRCNEKCGTKFSSFEDAMAASGTNPNAKAELNKGKTGRDIVQDSIEQCDKAMAIFAKVLPAMRQSLGMIIPDDDDMHNAPEGASQQIQGKASACAPNIIRGYVNQLKEAILSSYRGAKRTTATHALVGAVTETNKNYDSPPHVVLVIFVNSTHTPAEVASAITETSRYFAVCRYFGPMVITYDGEYSYLYGNDTKGGHTKSCTRMSQWSKCNKRASSESKEVLVTALPEECSKR